MNKFLTLYNQHFESSGSVTQQWQGFYKVATSCLRKLLTPLASNVKMRSGHFYFTGFFTSKKGQVYYFSISDIRCFPDHRLLIRKASSYTDYSGGANAYLLIDKDLGLALSQYLGDANA